MYLTYTSRMMESRQDGYAEGLHTGREEGISIGFATGRKEGREEGAYQNKLETARNLLAMGLSPEQVAQGTGLSLEAVMQLVV